MLKIEFMSNDRELYEEKIIFKNTRTDRLKLSLNNFRSKY